MNEKEFIKTVKARLQTIFDIQEEVWDDTGKKRIDMIITSDTQRFGIEFKQNNRKRGEEMGKFIIQATGYLKLLWSGTKMPILICPPLSCNYFVMSDEKREIEGVIYHKDRHDANHEHHTFNGFLCPYNIGEIRTSTNYFPYKIGQPKMIYFAWCNKMVWAEKKNFNTKWYSEWMNRL